MLGRGTSRTNVLGRGADGGSVLGGRGRGDRPGWANRSSQMSLGAGSSGDLPRSAKVRLLVTKMMIIVCAAIHGMLRHSNHSC